METPYHLVLVDDDHEFRRLLAEDLRRRGFSVDAVADAAQRAKLGKPESYAVRYVDEPMSPFESWLGRFAQARIGMAMLQDSAWLRGLLGLASPQLAEPLKYLESQVQDRNGPRVRAAAHCFCTP